MRLAAYLIAAFLVGYMILGPRVYEAMLHWQAGITGPG